MKFNRVIDDAYDTFLQLESTLSDQDLATNFIRWHATHGSENGGEVMPQLGPNGQIKYGPFTIQVLELNEYNEEESDNVDEYNMAIASADPEESEKLKQTSNKVVGNMQQRVQKLQSSI